MHSGPFWWHFYTFQTLWETKLDKDALGVLMYQSSYLKLKLFHLAGQYIMETDCETSSYLITHIAIKLAKMLLV